MHCCSAQFVLAQAVIRGPYLQFNSSNSTVVKWRTDEPTSSTIWFGLQPNNLNNILTTTGTSVDHEIKISFLNANTKYYYAVGDANGIIDGGTSDFFFHTAPVNGTATPFSAWIIGDPGTGNDGQFDVRDSYYAVESTETPLVIFLGDNAYQEGKDSEYQEYVFEVYHEMFRRSAWWSCPGNHDYLSCDEDNETGPYFDIFTFPKFGEAGGAPSNSERYYSFDYANVHFLSLDGELPDAQFDWLENDLNQTTQTWIIAIIHYPPYSKGSHDSDESSSMTHVREDLIPILESAGTDLVLTGHSHNYERSYLINGHYDDSNTLDPSMILNQGNGRMDGDGPYQKTNTGPNANIGTVYTVLGTSGQVFKDADLDHPVMYYGTDSYGSGLLEVEGNQLDFKYINRDGEIVGLDPKLTTSTIKLYPNPANDYLFIETDLTEVFQVRIY